jgi:hypothetical protein
MKRFEIGWLRDLNPGDRFYFVADKGKSVWEVMLQTTALTKVKMIGSNKTKSVAHLSLHRKSQIVFLTSEDERK